MARPFKLRRRVDLHKLDVPGDIVAVESALEEVGYYEPPVFGTGRSGPQELDGAIRRLQTDHGLKPDGIIEPDGPTAARINGLLTARRRPPPAPLRQVPDNPSADTLLAEVRREQAAERARARRGGHVISSRAYHGRGLRLGCGGRRTQIRSMGIGGHMPSELYERGLKVRKEVLGEEYVENALSSADDFNREFQTMVTEYCWGGIWGREGLSKQQRSINNLCMLAALNRPKEFEIHFRGALKNGCSLEVLREVLLQIAVYCGIPAGVDAFRIARGVLAEQRDAGDD